MLVEFALRRGMMQKIIVCFFAAYSTWSLCSAFAEQSLPTSNGAVTLAVIGAGSPSSNQGRNSEDIGAIRGQGTIFQEISEKGTQDQDFYKATVQAYKDFNEQTVKYISIMLGVVSVLVTILGALFFFMFRKTLADIRSDFSRDADRLRDVYSRTFDLLNEQAKTNLEIFKSRESELKTIIREGQHLYDSIRSVMKEISDNQRVREPVAEKLAEEKVAKGEEERKEIKDEVEDYKKDLEEFTKDNN